MTTPSFSFVGANTTRGLIASGEGSTEFFNPLLPTQLYTSNGFLVLLNGWNLNRRLADITGYAGTTATAVELLQMRAPRQTLLPATSALGVGRVFGRSYFWQYRWKNSRTGEHSGLSPYPATLTNLGTEQPDNSSTYLGQNAYFAFSVSDAPSAADTLELFRNASQVPEVVYLVDSVSLVGVSTVQILDDKTDDEILFNVAVDVANPSGFAWTDGVMPPVCKAWQHPTGRTFYYGINRFARIALEALTASVTQGSDLVTIDNVSPYQRIIEPGRVGQTLKFYTSSSLVTPYSDPTVYTIVKVESASTFRVTPEIDLALATGAAGTVYFAIVDERDARWTYMSEPGKPWLIDPEKTIATGDDYDDGVMAWFSIGGTTFCQTRRRIYAALNDVTLAPHLSIVYRQVTSEGTVGFNAGCETPFGWVYVHERLGVRLFDGSTSGPLDRDSSPFTDFMARTQFENFEPSMMEMIHVFFDADNHSIVVSYVPTGQGSLKETLVYSVPDRVWRGPYRERVACSGQIRTTTAENKLVNGDDFGNLSVREEQVLDMVPASNLTMTTTGTITSITSSRILNDSGATFNADTDERLRGCPIWFLYNSTYYFARIADILSATQFELDAYPVDEDGAAWAPVVNATYGIGSIRWEMQTAYLDAGEPILPKVMHSLHVRFKRGTAATTFEVGVSEDAVGTWYGQRIDSSTATQPTKDVNGTVFGELIVERGGATFQLRVRGISRTGDPQITTAYGVMTISKGRI